MIFISECTQANVYSVSRKSIKNIKNLENFTPKTATVNGVAIVDETQRNCLVHHDNFFLDLNFDHHDMNFNLLNTQFELLGYPIGGFFNVHRDRQRDAKHKYTILVYPKSTYTGGDLILKDSLENATSVTVIETSKFTTWMVVIFSIDLYHESKEVISGSKYVFKSEIYVNENSLREEKYEDSQLAD